MVERYVNFDLFVTYEDVESRKQLGTLTAVPSKIIHEFTPVKQNFKCHY